jgi:hypothetical protein
VVTIKGTWWTCARRRKSDVICRPAAEECRRLLVWDSTEQLEGWFNSPEYKKPVSSAKNMRNIETSLLQAFPSTVPSQRNASKLGGFIYRATFLPKV